MKDNGLSDNSLAYGHRKSKGDHTTSRATQSIEHRSGERTPNKIKQLDHRAAYDTGVGKRK